MANELRADIAAARGMMRVKIGAGREIKRLEGYLWEGEAVERMTTGAYGPGLGLVVLTDRRLLFVMDGMVNKKTDDFPLDKISSVQWGSGFTTGSITIFASGNKAEIKNVNKDDGKAIVDLLRHRLSNPAPPGAPTSTPAAAPQQADVMSQLKQLGELRDSGILTPEEFDAKKAELLKRL